MRKVRAVKVVSTTLVGVVDHAPNEMIRLDHGNCFRVSTQILKKYIKIVNMNYENLLKLFKFGVVKFPIEITLLRNDIGKVTDTRIPKEWLDERYCQICCPFSLLPLKQQERIKTVDRRLTALGLLKTIQGDNGLVLQVRKSFVSKYQKKQEALNGGYIYAPLLGKEK